MSIAISSSEAIHDVDIRLEAVTSNRQSSLSRSSQSRTPDKASPSKKDKKERKKGSPNKKGSNFAGTSGKVKAIDPLAEENKKHLENMENGFMDLLALHNTTELSSLCGMLNIKIDRKTKNNEKKDFIRSYVRRQIAEIGSPDKVYVSILKHMWEGTLFEYLRAKGQPLHSTEHDPRGFVIAYWRKMTKTMVPFDPYYVPQNLTNRAKNEKRSDDIVAILDTMEAKELAVKAAEVKIRREHDYTNVLLYLQSVTSLHNTEKEGRSYLIGEVEMCRAKVNHAEESITMLNSQLTELENRHEYVKESWVTNLSHTETVASDFFDQLTNNQSDKQNVNNLLRRQLLDVRTTGLPEFPGEEPDDETEDAAIARTKCDATIRACSHEEICKIDDTDLLIKRLGVRNRRERKALKAELREATAIKTTLSTDLEETRSKLEEATSRADEADR